MLAALAEHRPGFRERRDMRRCEAARTALLRSDEVVGDFFEQAGGDAQSPVRVEAAVASVSPAKGRVLHRLVRAVAPATVVEFGSALGVSGCYLASALRSTGSGRLVTVEASPSRHAVATRTIESAAPGVTHTICGLFDDHLGLLDGADLFFLDGNHWAEPTGHYVDEAIARVNRPAHLVLDDVVGYSDEMAATWARLQRERVWAWTGEVEGLGVLALGDGAG